MVDHTTTPLTHDSAAVMKYLDMYQGIINRMAGNSADCKKWVVALVSAIFLIVAEEGKIEFSPVVFIPILLFGFLDAYYLSLERFFIEKQQEVVDKLSSGKLTTNDLYVIAGPRIEKGKYLPDGFLGTFKAFAIWPFYGGMLVLVIFGVIVALL